MSGQSYKFTHAITRAPSSTIINGLRAVDMGTPSLELFKQHHADYVQALQSTGAQVVELDPLEEFPDSVFIEDAALCLPKCAVLMRPGTPSRLGEAQAVAQTVRGFYPDLREISGPGTIEGGDILTTEREVMVGLSARTSTAGVDELRNLLSDYGYKVRAFHTPEGVLHFKTDCSLLDEETILATPKLDASGCFDGYRVIHTAEGEEACANAIRFNELVILPDGFPKTAKKLSDEGYSIRLVGNSEGALLDGGMSCLSLRFTPPGL